MENVTKPKTITTSPITRQDITKQVLAAKSPFTGTPQIGAPLGPMVAQMLKEGQGLGGIRFSISQNNIQENQNA